MLKQIISVVSALACLSVASAHAETMPYMLGVGVHHGTFIEKPTYAVSDTLSAVEKYGFVSTRDDFGWSFLAEPGDTEFPDKLYRLKDYLERLPSDVVPILGLTLGSPLYNNGLIPTTMDAQTLYADFAGRAAIATKPYAPIIELWNEWNLGTGTRKKMPGTADDYVSLIKKATPEIRKASPHTVILVGGMGTDLDPEKKGREWVWTSRAISQGMLDYGDGLSVHFYNTCRSAAERRPAEAIGRLEKLDALLRAARGGKPYPIYITEVGWPGKAKGCGFAPEEQLAFHAQFMLWAAKFESVKGVWLYELKDNGIDPDDLEHHFGLLDYDYEEKPVMCAVQDVRKLLTGARFTRETKRPDGAVELAFTKSGGTMLAVFLPHKKGAVNYTVPAGMQARFVCEEQAHPAGSAAELRERPLIVTPGA